MTILSIAQANMAAAKAGFTDIGRDIIVAIMDIESSLNLSNPQDTFNKAFISSNGGTDFTSYPSYNNGQYTKYLGGIPNTGAQDIYGIFNSSSITQYYNPPIEYGVDYGVPFGSNVYTPFGGKVVYAGRTQWSSDPSDTSGGLVAIQTNVQGLGDEIFYILHLDTAAVTVGQTISAGTLIGTSGGQNTGGNWPASPQYSTGSHIEAGFNLPGIGPSGVGSNVNPLDYINNAISQGGMNPPNLMISNISRGNIPGTNIPNPFDPTTVSNSVINAIGSSDIVQRFGIILAGFTLVIIGILILFFASGGAQKTQQTIEEGAKVGAMAA